jgi:hypothetical protein
MGSAVNSVGMWKTRIQCDKAGGGTLIVLSHSNIYRSKRELYEAEYGCDSGRSEWSRDVIF